MTSLTLPDGVAIHAELKPGYETILTEGALAFIAGLHRAFAPRVTQLLHQRDERQGRIDAGELPDYLPETKSIREADWRVSEVPWDLNDRRVEITGPTDRKMMINALNCGAKVFMADCEDSLAPTWDNLIEAQINLRDAVRRTISYDAANGKHYSLNDTIATLIVRPRGWHLPEKHLTVDGEPVAGALVDFALYLFHNARAAKERGTGPYFYLPKLENHLEARLWNEIFRHAEQAGIVGVGQIKVTVLIETILAVFELDEILYELKDYIVGQNCGRWDYIFSFIKKFNKYPEFILPDRGEVTMSTHFLRSYSLAVIKACHRRGAFAIGGMAAQIPIKDDPDANSEALASVRADKEREVLDGHDGTWVAHPALVPVAMEIFDKHMPRPNQVDRLRDDITVTVEDLLDVVAGKITESGLRKNISVGVQYMAAWLGGNGCVPLYNLMEDAATAEISRAQLWQWIHHTTGVLDDGRVIDDRLFEQTLAEELSDIRDEIGADVFDSGFYARAAELVQNITHAERFESFLTLPAYQELN